MERSSEIQAESDTLACNLLAIDSTQREAHIQLAHYLFETAMREKRELPDGYAFRFNALSYDDVAQFVANERRCCPFFTFTIDVKPHQGPLWLRITGSRAAKQVLQHELGA